MTSFNAKGREFFFFEVCVCGGVLSVYLLTHSNIYLLIKFIIIVNSPKVTINRVRPKKFNKMPTYIKASFI